MMHGIPRRLTDVWKVRDDGKASVLSESGFRADVYEFSETGAVAWRLCDGKRSIRDIVSGLIEATGGDPDRDFDRISEDVVAFFNQLEEERLIEWILC